MTKLARATVSSASVPVISKSHMALVDLEPIGHETGAGTGPGRQHENMSAMAQNAKANTGKHTAGQDVFSGYQSF